MLSYVPMIFLVAGARPNFMKIAPMIWELKKKRIRYRLIHTGQHYDYEMSKVFFDELNISKPDYFLNAGSGSHAEQTAKIMTEFERSCSVESPDIVVVVGDVNSTLACSITAKKLNLKVAHIEAGLRSWDMAMPEEINRMVTDCISDYLFVTEKSGIENLKRQGKGKKQIFFVGNIMIDTLLFGLDKVNSQQAGSNSNSPFAVVTLHRPSNVDDKEKLKDILMSLKEISKDTLIYFPIHPRTARNIKNFKLNYLLENPNFKIMPPMSYLEFLALWKDAILVLTDSGGLQEETTALGIPCFTIRENTERPITVEEGTNILAGTTRKEILKVYKDFKEGMRKKGKVPELWDGKTAERILKTFVES